VLGGTGDSVQCGWEGQTFGADHPDQDPGRPRGGGAAQTRYGNGVGWVRPPRVQISTSKTTANRLTTQTQTPEGPEGAAQRKRAAGRERERERND